MLQKKQIILKIKLLAISLSICHLSSVFSPLFPTRNDVPSSESGCGRVSLMLIYSLLCVFVSLRLNNNKAAAFTGGQLEEVTDSADLSDADRPARCLRVCLAAVLKRPLSGGTRVQISRRLKKVEPEVGAAGRTDGRMD